jgi:hypothetical protein
VAHPQPESSEHNMTVGGSAPDSSLADAHPDASPGAVWLTMCAWCGRAKARGRWIDASRALQLVASWGDDKPQLTHGICPACLNAVTADADAL